MVLFSPTESWSGFKNRFTEKKANNQIARWSWQQGALWQISLDEIDYGGENFAGEGGFKDRRKTEVFCGQIWKIHWQDSKDFISGF